MGMRSASPRPTQVSCATVVWHGTFKVRWATHSESTASVSLIPAILQERVELATTFLGLQGVDSKGAVEFLTYSTVVLTVLGERRG